MVFLRRGIGGVYGMGQGRPGRRMRLYHIISCHVISVRVPIETCTEAWTCGAHSTKLDIRFL